MLLTEANLGYLLRLYLKKKEEEDEEEEEEDKSPGVQLSSRRQHSPEP